MKLLECKLLHMLWLLPPHHLWDMLWWAAPNASVHKMLRSELSASVNQPQSICTCAWPFQ